MIRWLGKLRAAVPRSIAVRGVLLIALVAVSVGGPLWMMACTLAAREQQRRQYECEAYLATALAGYLENTTSVGENRDEWLRAIAAVGRRVTWAALFDAEGAGLEFRRRTALPQEEIASQIDLSTRTPCCRPLQVEGVPSERFELITMPQAEGVTLAVIVDRDALLQPTGAGAVLWPAGIALAGLAASVAWFRLGIVKPLRRLAERLAGVQTALNAVALETDSPSELAALVPALAETRAELEKWRGEAAQLRNSLELTVAARTRRAERARHQAERKANLDALTRLGNRRLLEQELPTLFAAQQTAGGELSLVVLDVDHFKPLNDALGHSAGDEILAFLGDLIRATVRRGADWAARLGGDEFVLVLPDTTEPDACAIAARLAALFAQRARTLSGGVPPVGLSAGVASLWRAEPSSWQELLHLADEAMYRAKRSRCGVAVAGQPGDAAGS